MRHKAYFHSSQNRKTYKQFTSHTEWVRHPTFSCVGLLLLLFSILYKHTHTQIQTHTGLLSFRLHCELVYQHRPRSRSKAVSPPKESQSKPPSGEPFLQAQLIIFPLISQVPAAQRLINVVENRKLSILSGSGGGSEKHTELMTLLMEAGIDFVTPMVSPLKIRSLSSSSQTNQQFRAWPWGCRMFMWMPSAMKAHICFLSLTCHSLCHQSRRQR